MRVINKGIEAAGRGQKSRFTITSVTVCLSAVNSARYNLAV